VPQLLDNPGVIPEPLQGHNSLIMASNGTHGHSILIHSLSNANSLLGFFHHVDIKEDMPLPKVRTPKGFLCLALSQGITL
jgi:hypothetical protein